MPVQSLIKALEEVFKNFADGKNVDFTKLNESVEEYQQKFPTPNAANSRKIRSTLDELYDKQPFNTNQLRILWLTVLKTVIPLLIMNKDAVDSWWDQVFYPFLNSPTQLKPIVSDIKSILFYLLIYEEDDWGGSLREECAQEIARRLIELYLDNAVTDSNDQTVLLHRRQIVDSTKDILIAYGVQRPKELCTTFDSYFKNTQYRVPILSIFNEILCCQGPRLYDLVQTPFFDSLLSTLEFDESPLLMSFAVSSLSMLLPHVCNLINDSLTRIFCIFLRIALEVDHKSIPSALVPDNPSWKILTADITESSSSDTESLYDHLTGFTEPPAPEGVSDSPSFKQLFTLLYALYPVNFLKFLLNPNAYAEQHGVNITLQIDLDLLRSKLEPLLSRHTLHRNFLRYTSEAELEDKARWTKLDATKIFGMCTTLNVQNLLDSIGSKGETNSHFEQAVNMLREPAPNRTVFAQAGEDVNVSQDATPFSIKGNESGSHSAVSSFVGEDGTALPLNTMATQLMEEFSDNISISPSVNSAVSNTIMKTEKPVEQPVLSAADYDLEINAVRDKSALFLRLYRQQLFLQNELAFEKYMRQQHITNIARMRKEQVLDIAVEAERQKLYATNKSLKTQVQLLKQNLEQQKVEFQATLNRRLRWETDLNNKLKTMRGERKAWEEKDKNYQTALDNLQQQFRVVKSDQDTLAYEKTELKLQLQMTEAKVQELLKLKTLLDNDASATHSDLSSSAVSGHDDDDEAKSERLLDSEEREKIRIRDEIQRVELENENACLTAQLESLTKDMEALKIVSEAKVFELEKKLSSQISAPSLRHSFNVSSNMYESMYNELDGKYTDLLTRYRDLEDKFIAAQTDIEHLKNAQMNNTAANNYGSRRPSTSFEGVHHQARFRVNDASSNRTTRTGRSDNMLSSFYQSSSAHDSGDGSS
ncbi:hamartin [Schizosaccharomyces japonicus yFS275]|uniref:Hamartin n=1 Tax=Schizosaccharomyces japonicus (strain yFS275 / FY16936) TaxID=402676 RepID=B6JX63_SCHJY|nr:hamartin [Schizosaccharomyces japonicus yFS275]EEB05964.1 hamartin [Schizosaccharomyces japonicus yFS275]